MSPTCAVCGFPAGQLQAHGTRGRVSAGPLAVAPGGLRATPGSSPGARPRGLTCASLLQINMSADEQAVPSTSTSITSLGDRVPRGTVARTPVALPSQATSCPCISLWGFNSLLRAWGVCEMGSIYSLYRQRFGGFWPLGQPASPLPQDGKSHPGDAPALLGQAHTSRATEARLHSQYEAA